MINFDTVECIEEYWEKRQGKNSNSNLAIVGKTGNNISIDNLFLTLLCVIFLIPCCMGITINGNFKYCTKNGQRILDLESFTGNEFVNRSQLK